MVYSTIEDMDKASVNGVSTCIVTPAASVAASFQAIMNTYRGRILDCYNGTDQPVQFSDDGGTVKWTLAAGVGKIYNLGATGLFTPNPIYLQYTSSPCTTGSVDITVWT